MMNRAEWHGLFDKVVELAAAIQRDPAYAHSERAQRLAAWVIMLSEEYPSEGDKLPDPWDEPV